MKLFGLYLNYQLVIFEQSFTIGHLDDLTEMKTLIVYCKQFFAHFGHGTINRQ